jgi:HEAT repeat protein
MGELAFEPLIKALKSGDSSIREAAAIALGKSGNVRAIEYLNELVDDSDKGVRKAAKRAIENIKKVNADNTGKS